MKFENDLEPWQWDVINLSTGIILVICIIAWIVMWTV